MKCDSSSVRRGIQPASLAPPHQHHEHHDLSAKRTCYLDRHPCLACVAGGSLEDLWSICNTTLSPEVSFIQHILKTSTYTHLSMSALRSASCRRKSGPMSLSRSAFTSYHYYSYDLRPSAVIVWDCFARACHLRGPLSLFRVLA